MKRMKAITLGAVVGSALMLGMGPLAAEEQGTGAGGDSYMQSKPDGALHADELIGKEVRSRAGDEEQDVGSVSDLILDQEGRIAGVVLGVGGFLGVGQKNVAISWDEVELSQDPDTGEYVLYINADEEALDAAPEYEDDSGMME